MAIKINFHLEEDKNKQIMVNSMAKEIKGLLGCSRCIFNKDTCSDKCEYGISRYYLKQNKNNK